MESRPVNLGILLIPPRTCSPRSAIHDLARYSSDVPAPKGTFPFRRKDENHWARCHSHDSPAFTLFTRPHRDRRKISYFDNLARHPLLHTPLLRPAAFHLPPSRFRLFHSSRRVPLKAVDEYRRGTLDARQNGEEEAGKK